MSKDIPMENLKVRSEILYTHTVLMNDFFSFQDMLNAGLNMSIISGNATTMDDQIHELEKAYQKPTSGHYAKRLTLLEDKMNEIMDVLYAASLP